MRLISFTYFLILFISFSIIIPDGPKNSRQISSLLGESCFDHANILVMGDRWYTRNFDKLVRERLELKEYYSEFKSSIDDFKKIKSEAFNSKVKLLKDGDVSLAAKIHLIRNAKNTLDISYYIFEDDEVGNIILNELRKAVKRGVHVRVLVDSTTALKARFFSDQFKSLMALKSYVPNSSALSKKQIIGKAEVVIFNNMFNPRKVVERFINRVRNLFRPEGYKIPISNSNINRRLHDKIILMDAESPTNSMAIIGGRNIANEYHTLDSFKGKSFEFEDMDVLIKDTKDIKLRTSKTSLASSIQSYYDKIFYHIGNNHLANAIIRLKRKIYRKEMARMSRVSRKTFKANPNFVGLLKKMEEEKFFDEGYDNGMIRIVNEIQNINSPWGRILYNKVSEINPNSISKEIMDMIESADHTIDIVTPYAHFSNKEIEAIHRWLEADPKRKFRLITSSIATNDTLASQALIDNSLLPRLTNILNSKIYPDQLQVSLYGKADDVILGGDIEYGKLHAKFAVIDNKKSLVMTSNLDPRSRSLNSEVGVSIEGLEKHSKTALELTERVEYLESLSHKYGSREWKELVDHPDLKWKKLFSDIIFLIVDTFNLERNI